MLALGQDKFSDCEWLLCDKTQEPSLLATPMDYSFNLQFAAWLQGKVRGRPLCCWSLVLLLLPLSIYLSIYLSTNIYIYIYIYVEREREREGRRTKCKACSYFPREIDKILGYHRRNKGKNYVNFGDQMAGGWWYDWENHGICYHQTLWKRKRNNLGV